MADTKLYDVVKRLLLQNPRFRDSDRLLIWAVWMELKFAGSAGITYESFMLAPHTESIRRVRQKIQEQYPLLGSSVGVKRAKLEKQKTKGTWVYREDGTAYRE
jgi:hypothetical protein